MVKRKSGVTRPFCKRTKAERKKKTTDDTPTHRGGARIIWPGDKAQQKEMELKYPYFTKYMKENLLTDVMNSERIMKALYKNSVGALTKGQIAKDMVYGDGPVIQPKFNKEENYFGQLIFDVNNPQASVININADLIQKFENAMKNSDNKYIQQAKLTMVMSVIFHEYTHYGDALDNFSAVKDAMGNVINGTDEKSYFGNELIGDGYEEGGNAVVEIYGFDLSGEWMITKNDSGFLRVLKLRKEGKAFFNVNDQNSEGSKEITPSEIDPTVLPTIPSN